MPIDLIKRSEQGFPLSGASFDSNMTLIENAVASLEATISGLQGGATPSTSVKDFGASGNGLDDDTAAFQQAIQSGGAIYVPPGTYKLTARLTRANKGSFVLHGAGSQVSRLLWTGSAEGGLLLDESASHVGTPYGSLPRVAVVGLSLLTDRASGGTGLHVSMDRSAEPGVLTRDLFISGLDGGADYWTNGLVMFNCVGTFHTKLWINGRAGVPTSMGCGIIIDQATNGGSMVHAMSQVTIKWADIGIRAICRGTLGVEGIALTDMLMIGVNTGVHGDGNLVTGGYRPPYLSLQSSQIDIGPSGGTDPNARQCVRLQNFAQFFASNCVFYGDSMQTGGALVHATNTVDGLVDKCFFIDFATSSVRTGLLLDGACTYWSVNNCNFAFLATGINVHSSCSNIDIGLQHYASVGTAISDSGNVAYKATRIRTASGATSVATGTRITFGTTFPAAPTVVAVHQGTDAAVNVTVSAIDTTGCTLHHNAGGSVSIAWMAHRN